MGGETRVRNPATPANVVARREQLVQIVGKRRHVVVAELAVALGVSEMTVRRDIASLADERRVVSFYGGVRSPEITGHPRTLAARFHDEAAAKALIAARAAEYSTGGGAVALDAGSTTALLAQQLFGRSGLRVVTASVPVISALADAPEVDVVVLGGTLRRDTQSFIGPTVSLMAQNLQVETYFMGAAGLSERGAFDITDLDAVAKRELILVSNRVIALADSTKFAKRAMSRICEWEAIDTLITDDRIDSASLTMLREHGVEVDVVPLTAPAQPPE